MSSSFVIKKDDIFLTEFVVSNHFQNRNMAVTRLPGNLTFVCDNYHAPEVHQTQEAASEAHIFSLDCVFVEMLTVAAAIPFTQFREDFGGYPCPSYRQNLVKTKGWLADMQHRLPTRFLRDFIVKCSEGMLQVEPNSRLPAFEVSKSMYQFKVEAEGFPNVKLKCDYLLPWHGNMEEDCKITL
jgi:hypothetical protein